jgi:hypothetical protein
LACANAVGAESPSSAHTTAVIVGETARVIIAPRMKKTRGPYIPPPKKKRALAEANALSEH